MKTYASEKGFEIKTPIEYSAMKTVIVKQIDEIIDEYSLEEIRENIETLNQWAKVTNVYKFGTTSKMLKVQFDNTSMANKAVTEGMIILYQRIPPRQIEKEIFMKLTPCNNCFQYDHETKKSKEEKLTVCAFCGASGHKQSACKSTTPKCINCGRSHRTLAAQCLLRKQLIKTKRTEVRER